MAFTNGKDQIFSFVEPGANPGSATGNGLSLRCPVSYSGISTKFVDGGHRGVDYIASKGTPVYAATSGRVIRVYSWQGSTNEAAVDSIGNAVFLEHFDTDASVSGNDPTARIYSMALDGSDRKIQEYGSNMVFNWFGGVAGNGTDALFTIVSIVDPQKAEVKSALVKFGRNLSGYEILYEWNDDVVANLVGTCDDSFIATITSKSDPTKTEWISISQERVLKDNLLGDEKESNITSYTIYDSIMYYTKEKSAAVYRYDILHDVHLESLETDEYAPLTSDGSNNFVIPDFTGTLMLRVNGVKGKDVTGVFLLVSRDTTAPVLTLSAPVFYADRAAGSYQITGTADAGSKILCGENNESVYAAGDGSFAIQGTLEERQDGDALYIRAQDSAGNPSARQLALVARQTETYAVTVTTDGNGTASADLAAAAAGTNISLNATPNTGYHFKEWQVVSGGVTIENDKFIMPDGDVEIKAIFEKDAAPATPVPTAPAKPESSPTPAPAATAKPNGSPTPAPAATAKPNSSTPPAPAAAAKPNSSPTTAPAAAAKPNSSPTPAPAATAKPESSPALAPTATAKPDSSPTPAPTAPATKLPVWWVALPIVGGVALAGVFVMRKKKRRR